MSSCSLYKGAQLLGTGNITNGSTSITGWNGPVGMPAIARRAVWVAITSSTNTGSPFVTRVLVDNGASTLTLRDANPFTT